MHVESRGSGRGAQVPVPAISHVVNVQLDNGTRRSFTQGSNPPFREGDQIKVVDGRLALLAK
jgi:hypothetical protein